MNPRDAMYYTITAETFDGKKAAAMGVVNESVPRAKLRERVRELAKTLADKNAMTMRACKFSVKRVSEMSWDDADDYLMAKLDQMRFHDTEGGREKGMRQFLDEKTYRPGLGNYRPRSAEARVDVALALRPRSVAIVGASPEPGSMGGGVARQPRPVRLRGRPSIW